MRLQSVAAAFRIVSRLGLIAGMDRAKSRSTFFVFNGTIARGLAMRRRILGSPTRPLILVLALSLAACQTSEDRAERHYQSALASMEKGEVELALVDLRRVFDYDGFHRDARALYARTMRERGDLAEAYGQYLRLVEQYPEDLEGRVALAEMAFDRGDWEEFERHGGSAADLAAESPEVAPLRVALDYRAAALDEDNARLAAAAEAARVVLEQDPDDTILRRILISHLLTSDDPAAALPEIDAALERRPDDYDLHRARLDLVARAEDLDAIDAQLERMFEIFPENTEVQQLLLRWHLTRGDTDAAEAFLREVAALTPDDISGNLTIVRFLQRTRGDEAAMAELETLIAAADNPENARTYRAMIAAMTFEGGERDAAIEMQRALIEGAEANELTRDMQMMLARMLEETGDAEGARAVVATILEGDASHVEALKRRAAWAIEEDRVPDAMRDLRTALDQAPRDPEILTLMATGHEREGSLELAGERLSLAVEASGNAVPESVRYARFLLSRGRVEPARQVLQTALRGAPEDLQLIGLLGEIAVRNEDWAEAEGLRARLEGRTDVEASQIRQTLTAALMLSQNRVDETAEMLQEQIDGAGLEDTRLRSTAMLALLRASEGDIDGARAVLDGVLAENPQALPFRMLHVVLDAGIGDAAAAEGRLRAIVTDFPGAEAPVRELFTLLRSQGRNAEAAELIEAELANAPTSRYLRLVHGGVLSEQGRIDEAVAIYEVLYAEDTSDLVVANNYASLLGTHFGDDPAVLDRAANIARRLRGREVPAFQDTYGWIEFQRGNLDEALAHLEPSAAAQPDDAIVQYHLGRAYEAAERFAEARVQYERALELAEGSAIADLPQFAIARERLAALPAPAPGDGSDGAPATGAD